MRLIIISFLAFMSSVVWANSDSIDFNLQNTTNTIITVITVIVALITFSITVIIPVALRVYKRYNVTIRRMDTQAEMIRKIEDLIYQYEVDLLELGKEKSYDDEARSYDEVKVSEMQAYTIMTLSRFTLRKHLQDIINPPAHDIVTSQRSACSGLAQLITDPKSVWPRKLKSLIRFMRINGLLSNELLRSKEYKKMLVKELKDFAEDDSWDRNLSNNTLPETIVRDFGFGFIVLLSILIILAAIANGDGLMKWVIKMAQMIKDML